MQLRYTGDKSERKLLAIMENLEPENYKLHEGHDDDFDGDEELMDENHPMWRSERITLNSVGIDIGSSTSHLIFSRLTLRRQGVALLLFVLAENVPGVKSIEDELVLIEPMSGMAIALPAGQDVKEPRAADAPRKAAIEG